MAKAKQSTPDPLTGDIELPDEMVAVETPSRRHEVLGVIAGLAALFLLLSLASYDGLDAEGAPMKGKNLVGPAGTWTAYTAYALIGVAGYLVDLFLWAFGVCLFVGRVSNVRPRAVLGAIVVAFLASIALHAMLRGDAILGHAAGGFVGEVFGEISISLVSHAGTYLLTLGGIAITLLVVTDISLFLVLRALVILGGRGLRAVGRLSSRVVAAWQSGPEATELPPEPLIVGSSDEAGDATDAPASSPQAEATEPRIVTKDEKKKKKKRSADDGVESLGIRRTPEGSFQLPGTALLTRGDDAGPRVDRAQLKETAERLVQTLADFGVRGEVREIHPGPVVTMYEFQPSSGTKLSRIEGLSSEVAMGLEVKRVRVVAPIPGKNAVGFELPNREREIVRLRDMLEDASYASAKAKLPLALGKDISGSPFAVDLAKMPHLLMAGTTGSGKSVSVNTMLLSLLYRYTPDELRMLLIDPKMIEFQPYNAIPHLLLPVVTDMSQATLALKWAVDEMERRYQLFADLGARNLETYNRKVDKLLADEEARPAPQKTAVNADGDVVDPQTGERVRPPEKLPLVVICIDELADLMMVAAKDVETSIARLAQKARAAGIHLIIATQRPSTDVITGLIKANFPARLSCQVSSGTDSRTILNKNGAEKLLGNGDMLVLPPGTSDLVRVQGAFVDDNEIAAVVDFLKAQGAPTYDEEILKPREDEGGADVGDDEKDEVYDQAVAIVADAQFCSISMLQRKLRIGYNRSARIVEIMEKEGVFGPPNHQNKREVLVSPIQP